MSSRCSLLRGADSATAPQRLPLSARHPPPRTSGPGAMRRYADDDEVDLVIVGAGAGGSVLAQRLARAGWRIVVLESGPFWEPGRDWVSDEAGSHQPLLDPEADHRRRRSGRARQEQLRPRRRRLDGALRRLHAAVPPVGLRHQDPRRRRRGLADRLRGPPAPLRARSSASCRWPDRTGRGVTRTATRTRPTPSPAPRARGRGARRPASRCGRARRHPTARSATGRTASTAATACRAARSTPRRASTSRTSPTRSTTVWRSARTAWRCGSRSTTPPGRTGRASTAARRASAPRGRRRRGRPATRSRPAPAARVDEPPGTPTGSATATTRSGAT